MKDFVSDPIHGMQAYTQKLQNEVSQLNTLTLSEQQLLEVAATVGLPRYIFSGMQQVIHRTLSFFCDWTRHFQCSCFPKLLYVCIYLIISNYLVHVLRRTWTARCASTWWKAYSTTPPPLPLPLTRPRRCTACWIWYMRCLVRTILPPLPLPPLLRLKTSKRIGSLSFISVRLCRARPFTTTAPPSICWCTVEKSGHSCRQVCSCLPLSFFLLLLIWSTWCNGFFVHDFEPPFSMSQCVPASYFSSYLYL